MKNAELDNKVADISNKTSSLSCVKGDG